MTNNKLHIKGASANNLKNFDLSIPHHQLIAVTGVSGSGKSSLVYDIIGRYGQNIQINANNHRPNNIGQISHIAVDEISGVSPVIIVNQNVAGLSERSTVASISNIGDWLRLLFARCGSEQGLSKSHFSANTKIGQCPSCNGIGKTELIDIDKLIADPNKTLREGALAPSLPNGYIMYSQVTIDVLNQVCEVEGFNVDIPWNDLTDHQQNIILNGSEKIKVPFGKHSLESRLKWTGIKAKPREEGYYKGMLPIMSDILRRDRNANILKYVSAITCSDCNGSKLNELTRKSQVKNQTITELSEIPLIELAAWIETQTWNNTEKVIIDQLLQQITTLLQVGLGHLKLEDSAKTLNGSEIQRIKLCNQIQSDISNVLYLFDEPSIGLSKEENKTIIQILKSLKNNGNTVIVVEHDLETIKAADWIIDIGPKAGKNGGQLLFNGSFEEYLNSKIDSPTLNALKEVPREISEVEHDLEKCHVGEHFINKGGLNVISGPSGSGKRALVEQFKSSIETPTISINQQAIGRSPRSNPATYVGFADQIRDLFSKQESAKTQGLKKGYFSFNNKGGRCETCEGAGVIKIGMHYLGVNEQTCPDCNGKRFTSEVLSVNWQDHSIADIYKLSVNEAYLLFKEEKKIGKSLKTLKDLGLGYLTIGQPATTLSGGEAQRIKLAKALQNIGKSSSTIFMEHPCDGLHHQDIQLFLQFLQSLCLQGHTIIVIDQDENFLSQANHLIELRGKAIPSLTLEKDSIDHNSIQLKGITTHHLKNIDVTIPKQSFTVVTGMSGSGKSSLINDTLLSTANSLFNQSQSLYQRNYLKEDNKAKLEDYAGIPVTIPLKRQNSNYPKKSTIGTLSGIYNHFRLLFSRWGETKGFDFSAQDFSFHHQKGACEQCNGVGKVKIANGSLFINDQSKNIFEALFYNNKALNYYTDPNGQFIATLKEVAKAKGIDLTQNWKELPPSSKAIIYNGTGETEWTTEWHFKTKTKEGTQTITAPWKGLKHYIEEEYFSKLHNKKIDDLEALMKDSDCPSCKGNRLKEEQLQVQIEYLNITLWMQLSIDEILLKLKSIESTSIESTSIEEQMILEQVSPKIISHLEALQKLGLGYLQLDRSMNSLSGGEKQRILIGGQIKEQLYGVCYILDEPSIGLDQQQIEFLGEQLKELIKQGNTVIAIDHHPSLISEADHIIEIGPGSGEKGGNIIFEGNIESLQNHPETVSNQLLNRKISGKKTKTIESPSVKVLGANKHNLKNLNVSFPIHRLSAITGVSGSGKSSLMKEVIYQSWKSNSYIGCKKIEGFDYFEQVIYIDQKPINSNHSLVAEYLGILDLFQKEFAKSFKDTGIKKSVFSFHSKEGKCKACNGTGKNTTHLDYIADLKISCKYCKGFRYNENILKLKIEDYSIGDLIQLSVDQLPIRFKSLIPNSLTKSIESLQIGHIKLNQSLSEISGGESQRLKLCKHLFDHQKEKVWYLIDEPSIGLHYLDQINLVEYFQSLINKGNTISMIEHNSFLLEKADQIIELGPVGGDKGGYLIS